jgi:hypothetical protein
VGDVLGPFDPGDAGVEIPFQDAEVDPGNKP